MIYSSLRCGQEREAWPISYPIGPNFSNNYFIEFKRYNYLWGLILIDLFIGFSSVIL